ncbi:MAG: 4Fe-4S binding protein [Halomonas sp.]
MQKRNDEILKDKPALRVRSDLCLGCGLCAERCPQRAISLRWEKAQIDQSKYNRCGLCLDICPQGAIIELAPVSKGELEATVAALKDRANDIIARAEKLQKQ